MHTAFELKRSMFTVEMNGYAATREELLNWELRDRLGVVMTSPFGALGAGLLILLSVTAFYDMEKQKRRMRPLYPSIYLFHVGRPWGFHGEFDFWPERKEVILNDPARLLPSINSHGITHLVVPDGIPQPRTHRYKEPEEALDRLKQAYAYGPGGTVDNADIVLRSSELAVLRNFQRTVHLPETLELRTKTLTEDPGLRAGTPAGEESRRYVAILRERLADVEASDAAALRARQRVDHALEVGSLSESLRRIDIKTALSLLD
jgi:hypothetical protein